MPDSEISEIDGKINEIGKLEAHVHYTFRGDEELMLRSDFPPRPGSAMATRRGKRQRRHGRRCLKFKDQRSGRDPRALHHVLRCFQAELSRLVEEKSDLTLPLCQFNLPDLGNGDDDDSDGDAEPLKLGPKAEYIYKIKLELPAKYTAHAPLPFSLRRDYAEYDATYKLEGSTFTAARTLTMRQAELPALRATDYQAFRRAVGSDLGQFLSVENTVAGTLTPPADMKADDLFESGRAAYASNNLPLAIELLKRATEVDPKNKYAWYVLAVAYMGTAPE